MISTRLIDQAKQSLSIAQNVIAAKKDAEWKTHDAKWRTEDLQRELKLAEQYKAQY